MRNDGVWIGWGVCSGGRRLDFGRILVVEFIGFVNILDVECERKI